MMKHPISLFFVLAACAVAHASDTPDFYGEANCRIASLEPHPKGDLVRWSGACKDGFADGPGVLAWRVRGEDDRKLEATLARGEVVGEATLTVGKGIYIGTLKRGVPHGNGYQKLADGTQYEGGFRMGKYEGKGIRLYQNTDRYEGEWKDGKRDGAGRMTFLYGGSYEGQWKADQFDGMGKIIYAGSGRSYEGLFKNGRVAGAAVPELPSEDEAKFEAWNDDDRTGSPMWTDPIISDVPMDADWSQLTRPQQNWIRSHYPALEEGDDPPYPLGGSLALHQLAKKAHLSFGQPEGALELYVLVGADGVAKSVTTIGSPHPELTRYVATAGMLQRYKPAMCHGQPCEMAYVYAYKFTTR